MECSDQRIPSREGQGVGFETKRLRDEGTNSLREGERGREGDDVSGQVIPSRRGSGWVHFRKELLLIK
jgi:hypothetical protein